MFRMEHKQLSFCIVCRNRLEHLQQTLITNLKENNRKYVEFVLLDYNSDDGLGYWVKENLMHYLSTGILVYYRNSSAYFFHRTHSRNMAIRLSTGKIVCNLDADNYLGEGNADYILNLFHQNENIFVTSDYSKRDIVGRVYMYKNDFVKVNGYNEAFEGYGFEDVELYHRLQKSNLNQIYLSHPYFFRAISHSNGMRINQERLLCDGFSLYIHYITPYKSGFLVFYHNYDFIQGELVNNFNKFFDDLNYEKMDKNTREISPYRRIVLSGPIRKGKWERIGAEKVCCRTDRDIVFLSCEKSGTLLYDNELFYKIVDSELCNMFMMILSEAINYRKALELIEADAPINPSGFGRGVVFKNFDYKKAIYLR